MPKSYLADEPGAQRAERNAFDPYLQTYNRLVAYQNTGHQTEKVEIIVLGGTWSYYPEPYQIWFITECFRAMNDFSEGRDDRDVISARYEVVKERLQAANEKLGRATQHVATDNPIENKVELAAYQVHGEKIDETYNQVVSLLYTAPEKVSGVDQLQTATWDELEVQQKLNETSKSRCVGLVIETRPDNISEAEVRRIRRLGCTKTQIGFQSLNDMVLVANKRGHDVSATRRAVKLLRQAGFKIHAHWMPNLHGSTPELDKADYVKLFSDPDFCPDELKIYPCSLIESAELMQYYQRGEWRPYSEMELLDVLGFCLMNTPRYCRLTRVIRDIPSTDIVVGNKKTNFRELVEKELQKAGEKSQNIRAREIRGRSVTAEELQLKETLYPAAVSTELFLEYVAPHDGTELIAGFLRLSLPTTKNFMSELQDCAIIREVHVYGQSVGIGQRDEGKAQHLGLGTKLIERAKVLAAKHGFKKLAVISAIGTREYYRQRGFVDDGLYQVAKVG
jgi:elongator complex protein 3